MRHLKPFLIAAGLAFALALLPQKSSSAERSETDTICLLCDELNKMQMTDYSEYLLLQEIAKNTPDKDLLCIQLAKTYFIKNQADKADEIIGKIQPGSKFYADSRHVLGMEAAKKGKFELAAKAFEEYFKVYAANPPTTESGKKDFENAIAYSAHSYKQLGQPEKAAKIMELINKVREGGMDENSKKLISIQAKLDAVEKQIGKGEKGWETIVNDTSKICDDLLYLQDSVGAFGFVEKARCLFFLGRHDDALKLIATPERVAFFRAFDEPYEQEKNISGSPGAARAFWAGKICIDKAEKAADDAGKIESYSQALQSFYEVVDKYDQFPRFEEVKSGFMGALEKLKGFGKNVKIPKRIMDKLAQGSSLSVEAKQAFEDGKYEKAIPLILEGIHKSRTAKDMPEVLSMLAFSYLKTEQILEALSVAGYLAEYYSKSPNTALSLAQVGEALWKKAEKAADKDQKKAQIDEAIVVYELYLDKCKADQYAGPIASRVAKVYFDRAEELGKLGKELPQGKEKAEMVQKARDAYKEAIPKYQRIVENYAQSDIGINAFYLLAFCYSNAKDHLKAAETFLEYVDRERQKDKNIDIASVADAKFRAGESYFQQALFLSKEAEALRDKADAAPGAAAAPEEEKPAAPPPPAGEIKDEKKEEKKAEKKEDKKAADKKDEKKKEEPKKDEKAAPAEDADAAKPADASGPKALNAKADEYDKLTKQYALEAVKNFEELTGPWCAKGGPLENEKSPKIALTIENAAAMTGWGYDTAGEKEKACKAFSDFLSKYTELKSKHVPSCMLRLGTLYVELKKPDIAAQILEKLAASFPETSEGKQALTSLGKSMYEIGNYDKSIDAFGKVFEQKIEVPIQSMQWITANLYNCGGTHPKKGAQLSVQAGSALLELLKNPKPEDWVSKDRMKEYADKPDEINRLIGAVKDRILFETASGAFWSEDYQGCVKLLDECLNSKTTRYLFDGKFLRAQAYKALKRTDDVVKNYVEIITDSSFGPRKSDTVYFKAQCMLGELYIEMNDFNKAYNSFAILSLTDPTEETATTKSASPEELKEQKEYLETAFYKTAFCLAKLGRKDEAEKFVEKYKKYFPTGKYLKDIQNLPEAAPAPAPEQEPKPPKEGKQEKEEKPPAKDKDNKDAKK